jgi:hypothetical protein
MASKSSAVCVTQMWVSMPTRRTSSGTCPEEAAGFDCVRMREVISGTS